MDALIVETPDLATWHEALQTDQAVAAMKYDGVRRDTILELVEGLLPVFEVAHDSCRDSAAGFQDARDNVFQLRGRPGTVRIRGG